MRIRSPGDIAAAVRGRRRDLGWSQSTLAEKAEVSRKWISELEAGKAGVELGLVLRVFDQLGLSVGVESAARRTKNAIDLKTVLDRHRSNE